MDAKTDSPATMLTDGLTRDAVEWRIAPGLTPYNEAVAFMEERAAQIAAGQRPELIWLVEHPPIYTAGTSAKEADLLDARFPVFKTGRGGQYTYHGPGQRVGYAMLDLKRRGADVRAYVRDLEEWLIRTLAAFNVKGERREGRVGIWVQRGSREDKIAALGVRVRRWVTFHGVSINVDAADPLIVLGDRDELVRIFENLVENALKYGASGKRVDIALTAARSAEDEPEAQVSVRDYGPGIAPEHLPRLTERFYRVDVTESRAQGGTGLGLALVKHILNRHRGRLAIESSATALFEDPTALEHAYLEGVGS